MSFFEFSFYCRDIIDKYSSLIISGIIATAGALLGVLPLDAASTATSEGRLEAEVDVLLAVQTHDEGRNVHDLK